jgi:beta-fructofuranosidase
VPLRLADRWIWDFWLARRGPEHHVFYLQAPRALGDPELRHHHASVGHAVSTDLRSWRVLPDALHPGLAGSWDDLATWTGSVTAHGSRWHMLYTGVSRAEDGLIQRIGLASSDDLVRWTKHPANPVLEADPRWYEQYDATRWRDQSWRDPWLFRTPDDDHVHVLVTARTPAGPSDGAGVVAHARSLDLVEWEVQPPLTAPGEFAQVEVPQLVRADGHYELLVSCLAEDHSQQRRQRLGRLGTGTFSYASEHALGPYAVAGPALVADDGPLGTLYAGKLVDAGQGRLWFMAFRGLGDPAFAGELTDPLEVRQGADGRLTVRSGRGIDRLH